MSDQAVAASRARILIVEDAALVVEELKDCLRRLGHEVVGVADTAPVAIDLAVRERPDVVLMAIRLKGPMDGVEAAGRIYGRLGTPVIYVTAYADPATLERATKVGPFGYIVKPFRESDLRVAIAIATSRHALEQRLKARKQDAEELFRIAFEEASIGVGLLGADGRIVRVNAALAAMLGYMPEELSGRQVSTTRAAESRRALLEAMPEAVSVLSRDGALLDFKGARDIPTAVPDPRRLIGKKLSDPELQYLPTERIAELLARAFETRETQLLDYDVLVEGRPRARESSIRAISDTEAVWVSRDVTRQRDAARKVRENDVKLRVALTAARMGTFEWDIKRDHFEWDDTLCEIYGVTQETMPRGRVAFRSFVHPEDQDRVRTLADSAVSTGEYRAVEFRIQRRDGTIRWVAARGALTRAEDGSPAKIVGGILDVTPERTLDEQRRTSQRLAAIGQLAAGIAHNFNNMLMGILPNIELALPEASPGAAELLRGAQESAMRAAEMVRQLVTFAGQTRPAVRRVEDVTALVLRSLQICRRTFDRSIELPYVLPDQPHTVLAEPATLEQALLNILINARDAVIDSRVVAPVVRVHVDRVSAGAAEISECDLAPGREYVRVRVWDNGPGMDEATRSRIFEPFFTTKDLGRGTGLGLSTTMSIVREHGGAIACTSRPGAGTTFSVYLPHAAEGVTEVAAPPPGTAQGGSETILVVDDERAIRAVVHRILTRHGYDVRLAAGGAQAIEQLGDAETREKVALVLLDMSMPAMPGSDVRRLLRELIPTARVAYFTGYSSHPQDDVDGVIEKPIASETLLRRVREILDRGPCVAS
jgi:PAS domain S-box-containing protein